MPCMQTPPSLRPLHKHSKKGKAHLQVGLLCLSMVCLKLKKIASFWATSAFRDQLQLTVGWFRVASIVHTRKHTYTFSHTQKIEDIFFLKEH